MTCETCGDKSKQYYIKSIASGGLKDDSNIISLCDRHCESLEKLGRTMFIASYQLNRVLEAKGWLFDDESNKWIAPNES